MAGRPVKALPEVPEVFLSPQQLDIYRLVRAGSTVREAAARLGIPAKQASKQLAAIRRKAGALPPSDVTAAAEGTPAPRHDWQEEALALIEGRGLSPWQAARRLGVAPGAVRTVLWRRRKSTGQAAGGKIRCYGLGEGGYLPAATHPGTGFGLRLRHCRRRAGLSLEEVAVRAGLAVELLERLERGQYLPPWPAARRLCRVLDVDLDDLVTPCGQVELTRELLLLGPGMGEEGPRGRDARRFRVILVRRLAAGGGKPLTLPGSSVVVHGKGGKFVLHLDKESRSRARRVLIERRLRLLEREGDGGAFYLAGAGDLPALGEELAGRGE